MPKLLALILALAAGIALGCGEDDGGASFPQDGTLGNAVALALHLRDQELPTGYLYMIASGEVDTNAVLVDHAHWWFGFTDAATTVLNVHIFSDGYYEIITSEYFPELSENGPPGEIPAYDNALEWVAEAEETREEIGVQDGWESRLVTVVHDDTDEFPGVECTVDVSYVTVLDFYGSDDFGYVLMDADTNEVLASGTGEH